MIAGCIWSWLVRCPACQIPSFSCWSGCRPSDLTLLFASFEFSDTWLPAQPFTHPASFSRNSLLVYFWSSNCLSSWLTTMLWPPVSRLLLIKCCLLYCQIASSNLVSDVSTCVDFLPELLYPIFIKPWLAFPNPNSSSSFRETFSPKS